jgi:hypothetical protein
MGTPIRRTLIAAFALLLVAAPAAGSGSGIHGRVVASPTCPVERVPPDPRCAPRGLSAIVRIYRLRDHRTVARLHTSRTGYFRARLNHGRYGASARPATGRSLPRCPPQVNAVVHTGRYTRVTINCDTGIR